MSVRGCPTGCVSGLVSGAGELTSGSMGRGEGSLAKGGRDDDDEGSGLDSWRPRVSCWMAVGAGRPSILTPQRSWSKGPRDRSTYDLKAKKLAYPEDDPRIGNVRATARHAGIGAQENLGRWDREMKWGRSVGIAAAGRDAANWPVARVGTRALPQWYMVFSAGNQLVQVMAGQRREGSWISLRTPYDSFEERLGAEVKWKGVVKGYGLQAFSLTYYKRRGWLDRVASRSRIPKVPRRDYPASMKLTLILVLTHLLVCANAHPPCHDIHHLAREPDPVSVQAGHDDSGASQADGSLSAAINDLGGVSAVVGELSAQGAASGGSIAIVEDWKALGHTLSSGVPISFALSDWDLNGSYSQGGPSQQVIAYGSRSRWYYSLDWPLSPQAFTNGSIGTCRIGATSRRSALAGTLLKTVELLHMECISYSMIAAQTTKVLWLQNPYPLSAFKLPRSSPINIPPLSPAAIQPLCSLLDCLIYASSESALSLTCCLFRPLAQSGLIDGAHSSIYEDSGTEPRCHNGINSPGDVHREGIRVAETAREAIWNR
ncbi:hypothetical protein K488DRAFT_75157 [Vararia minispora EC-137]|uniref:Uncharacterized protein n=1 Tax=Vararia minispora EC-137 TaxID=1314806 RepID=A0ACB8Q4Y6_9AGAM|nr:hypothetical protein K488DRAFT_75157 [Vararia minispora EC-137]